VSSFIFGDLTVVVRVFGEIVLNDWKLEMIELECANSAGESIIRSCFDLLGMEMFRDGKKALL
jgi:hypothetical protein